jgi:excisionase family DNA binding protein
MPRLLTEAQVCEHLSITPRHLRELRYRRDIPFVKVGRLVRFRPAEVDAWLEANTVEMAS